MVTRIAHILCVLCFILFALVASPVSAQGTPDNFLEKTGLTLSNIQSCPLTAGSTLYGDSDLCKPSASDGILGEMECIVPNIVTNFEALVSQVFSQMYCSVQEEFVPVLGAVLTLFVIGFGVMFMLGIVDLSAKEAMTRLLKLILVWAFATQAQYGIGIAYNILTNVPKAGMEIALGTLVSNGGTAMSPGEALQQPINIMLPLPRALNDKATEIDASSTKATGSSEIMKVFLALSIFMVMLPPVFAIVFGFFIQVIMTFVRTFTAYLLSIGAIAFLLTLSPIFLSFALFQMTYEYFERWLKYLTSFAIQIIIIFSFLALLQLLNPVDFFEKMIGVGYPYEVSFGMNHPVSGSIGALGVSVDTPKVNVPITVRANLWSVCRGYEVNDEILSKDVALKCPTDWRYNPYCNNYETPTTQPAGSRPITYNDLGIDPTKTPEKFGRAAKESDVRLPKVTVNPDTEEVTWEFDDQYACYVTDDNERRPIPQCETAPADDEGVCPNGDPIYNVIPMMELVQDARFLKYIVLNIIAFFLLLYVMEAALRAMPNIAKQLSGLDGGATSSGTQSSLALGSMTPGGKAGGSGGAIDFLMRNKVSLNNLSTKSLGAFREAWKPRN